MKRQKISSSLTIFYKFVIPTIWVIVWGIVVIVTLMMGKNPMIYLIIFTFGFLIYWGGNKYYLIYEIQIDDRALYVSDLHQEIQIPFTEIQSVIERPWSRDGRIRICLKKPSLLGNTIEFIPDNPYYLFGHHPHPLATKIKKLAHLPETDN